MPRRDDLKSVLVIGSGPIIIGQACEFDYSGTQACRVLRAEGIRVSLVNSNPATIMTDPEFADATYVEPITPDVLAKVIARERPDAILPTLGGQTALNAAVALHDNGTLAKYDVELIGASIEAIRAGEDRSQFKDIVIGIGAEVPASRICHTLDQCRGAAAELGFPVVVRPSFTLGGTGSGIARTAAELDRIAGAGLDASPVTEVLLEESVLGWKEFELELMRDKNDNVVIVCSIENIDPMGVHTGDSVTVAPAMTLTDREYQHMRDVAIATARAVGVDTGGCNIQFAVHPQTGRMVVIEMNPRVSRSSALASKATGFPIAKIAARLAIGYTLDEIRNDITGETPASFEPSLDYVVVKVPRFAFEKFPGADPVLTTHMKSVGEAMAIGSSFAEALQKAQRSLEQAGAAFSWAQPPGDKDALLAASAVPHDGRLATLHQALRAGATVAEVSAASSIDPWFADQIAAIEEHARWIQDDGIGVGGPATARALAAAKALGFSDAQLGQLTGRTEAGIRELRQSLGVRPVYHTVDTCAAEFAARTPYLYSTYDLETEVPGGTKPKVIILGSGPNRIGQGIEFDYACVHASFALADAGYETVMVNCNPETVSTDYDTSGRLYFEPLTLEDVLEVVHAEQATGPVAGVIVQLGGQTPLGLARALEAAGVPVVGTSPSAIHLAEDRGEFGRVLAAAGLLAPRSGTATSVAEAESIAHKIGYPVLVRPSYVLGGRGMEIVYDDASLADYVRRATEASPEHPVLIDRFLDDAIELDVDALYDGEELYLGGVMEHIEEAGIHSGDSACALPPITLGQEYIALVRSSTEAIARGVGVRGLLNVQYALAAGVLYVLEANPRASRTVPFVSKATAVPLAKAAARVMLGASIASLRAEGMLPAVGDGGTLPLDAPIAVKEAVLPFNRFADARGEGVDTVLGPEMRSTGEVMGIDEVFGTAYAKSQAAAYGSLPVKGRAFVSVAGKDKRSMIFPVKRLADLGFEIWATRGTQEVLRRNGVHATIVRKHSEGRGPDGEPTIVDRILDGQVDLIVNTPFGGPGQSGFRRDGYEIRTAAVRRAIPCITTVQGLWAAVQGIEAIDRDEVGVRSLQEHTARLRGAPMAPPPMAPPAMAPPAMAPQAMATGDGHPGDGASSDGARGTMTPSEMEAQAGPVQVRGTVLTVRRVDAYYAMTLVAPAVAARFKPGQFVTLAVGGPDSSMLLSRAFSIHDVRPDHGGTVEFVFAVHGRGTQWLAERRARDVLDVTGPLGRPFPLPRDPANCLLVGGGYGSAPLFALASKLRERRCEVDFLLGAGRGDRVFGALTARRTGRSATITTEDGSLGSRGLVTDMLDQVIHDGRTDVIYACGPMPMLRQVTALARRYDIPVQAAVEEAMACGIGVCMTCVLPVVGSDGITRMVRSCVDGPVFRGESVRWDDVGTIPFDAFGAPGWEPRSRRAQLQRPAAHADQAGNGAAHGLGKMTSAADGQGGVTPGKGQSGKSRGGRQGHGG